MIDGKVLFMTFAPYFGLNQMKEKNTIHILCSLDQNLMVVFTLFVIKHGYQYENFTLELSLEIESHKVDPKK